MSLNKSIFNWLSLFLHGYSQAQACTVVLRHWKRFFFLVLSSSITYKDMIFFFWFHGWNKVGNDFAAYITLYFYTVIHKLNKLKKQ